MNTGPRLPERVSLALTFVHFFSGKEEVLGAAISRLASIASGGRGVALVCAEQVALSHLPGGLDALEVEKEDMGTEAQAGQQRQETGEGKENQS